MRRCVEALPVPVLVKLMQAPPLCTWAHRQPAPCQAKELGVRSVIIDGPDSWSQSMVKEGMVERFVGIDFSDADTIFDRCLAAINKIKQVHAGTAAHLQARTDCCADQLALGRA